MAGSIVNLNDPAIRLPNILVVDTNVIIERLSSSFGFQSHSTQGPRARNLFRLFAREETRAIIPPAIFVELAHIIVKLAYVTELSSYRKEPTQRFGPLSSWTNLYKHDPSILKAMRPVLGQLNQLLVANRLVFLDPNQVHSSPPENSVNTDLIDLMCRYGLDSADTMILIEARQLSVFDIVTFDPDMQRAQQDFTIHTWF